MAETESAMLPAPRVTVLLPVFNGATWLTEAVESVLQQTLEDLELVAVDDGSDDGSGAILEHFEQSDPRVRIVTNQTNLGISAALNRGWRLARAPYIARLDSDDVALPDRLVRQADFLDAHPSVAVVGGAAVVIDAEGRPVSTIQYPTSSRAIRATLPHHNCLAHPAVTLRRAALEQIGGYRLEHLEDYDLWLRLSEHFELANLPEPVILYRQHPQQFSFRALEEQATHLLAVHAAARARRAGCADPLAGVHELTPATLDRLEVDQRDITRAVDRARLAWAVTLEELGRHEESQRLVAQTAPTFGGRVSKTFTAATELKRAETLLSAGRPLAAAAHLLRAIGQEPRYALSRSATRLRDWLPRRGPSGRM